MFHKEHSFEKRKDEAERILKKYPTRIPIIIEKVASSQISQLDKKKYLVPADMTVGQFIYIIRKRISLKPEQGIFIFVKGVIPTTSSLISEIYQEYKDKDGFLYCNYSGEQVYG